MDSILLTLAQEDAPPAAGTPSANPVPRTSTAPPAGTEVVPGSQTQDKGPVAAPVGFPFPLLLLMIGGIAVMMIFSQRSESKKRKKHQAMLTALRKGDKVETYGGILGSVVEVRDNEVVLKVDENTNTRIKFARHAIRTVLTNGASSSQAATSDQSNIPAA